MNPAIESNSALLLLLLFAAALCEATGDGSGRGEHGVVHDTASQAVQGAQQSRHQSSRSSGSSWHVPHTLQQQQQQHQGSPAGGSRSSSSSSKRGGASPPTVTLSLAANSSSSRSSSSSSSWLLWAWPAALHHHHHHHHHHQQLQLQQIHLHGSSGCHGGGCGEGGLSGGLDPEPLSTPSSDSWSNSRGVQLWGQQPVTRDWQHSSEPVGGLSGHNTAAPAAAVQHSSSSGAVAEDSLQQVSSSSSSSSTRKLLQQGWGTCPPGCKQGACVPLSTSGGFVCVECSGSLVVSKVTGMCICPGGRYLSGPETCSDCPRGKFCAGGNYDPSTVQPGTSDCPDSMTTLGLRSRTIRQCVNMPGYYYRLFADGRMEAVRCPPDTYGAGFRKQRACVPCPTGFTTGGADGQTSPGACGVPRGFFLKAPGVAAPCGQGTYKNTTRITAQCTACPTGTTTEGAGSPSADACTVLEPGSYAFRLEGQAIREARACPQKYWCPGGTAAAAFDPLDPADDATIKACPNGMWTQGLSSTSAEQCLVPPGFFVDSSSGMTTQCPGNSFRAGWALVSQAGACESCGNGVQLDPSERIAVFNITTGAQSLLPVGTSGEDCFVQAGQGLYFESTTGTYRARNCDRGSGTEGEFGVSNRTYGLSPSACRTCPRNQVSSADRAQFPVSASFFTDNGDGTQGFRSLLACVNPAGYGLSATTPGSDPCAAGFYNERDTYGTCKPCPDGTTTDVGSSALGTRLSDCGVQAGYGFLPSAGGIRLCPVGTYNDAPYTEGTSKQCSNCPTGTITSTTGATSSNDCNLCLAGLGGADCSTTCGGPGSATYQPPGQPVGSTCKACPVQSPGYNFYWQSTNYVFTPGAVARAGATSEMDCLAEFAQIQDGSWWLPLSSTRGVTSSSATDFAECVSRCTAAINCQLVTYDYNTTVCSVRVWQAPQYVGPPVLALKAVPSKDLGTDVWSPTDSLTSQVVADQQAQPESATPRTTVSGHYSYYDDPYGLDVGTSFRTPEGAAAFSSLQDCIDACDDEPACAGFTIAIMSDPLKRPPTCRLILGDATPGSGKRTLIRAVITRLTQPSNVP